MSTASYIPSDDEVSTPQSGKETWRISEGKIVTGREIDGSLKEREKIVGALRRIGAYFGNTKDGKPVGQLEADIEIHDGSLLRLKTSVLNTKGELFPSVAAVTFAEGLLDIAAGEVFVITAAQSVKANAFGKFASYTNLGHYNPETKVHTRTARSPFDSTQTMASRWEELVAKLKAHPAYADRPQKEAAVDANTHLSALIQECQAKKWPHPEQAPQEWLNVMAKAFPDGGRKSKITDYNDDEWGQARQSLEGKTTMPALLADFDPFAD